MSRVQGTKDIFRHREIFQNLHCLRVFKNGALIYAVAGSVLFYFRQIRGFTPKGFLFQGLPNFSLMSKNHLENALSSHEHLDFSTN